MKSSIIKFLNLSRVLFAISFLLASGLLFISYNSKDSMINSLESKFIEFITPLMKVLSSEAYSLSHFSHKISSFFKTREEFLKLEAKNQDLEKYYYLYRQIEAENNRLKEEIKYASNIKQKFISAQIIGRPYTSEVQQVIIDVGLDKGVKKGDFVLSKEQLIGRVVEIFKNSSRVLLINDQKSRIPSITIGSRIKFIVAGQSTKYLACKYLNEKVDLQEGEIVTTSAEDVNMPAGIIIGSVFKDEDDFFVNPNMNLDKIEFVQILLSANE